MEPFSTDPVKLAVTTKKAKNPNQIAGKILLLKVVEQEEILVMATFRAV
jgi:hypothetical protein